MSTIATLVDSRLANLPCGLELEWPGGRLGSNAPAVRLKLHHRRLLWPLARGRIGELADAYVRGDLDIDGNLADVMAVAGTLAGDPVAGGDRVSGPRWLRAWLSRQRHDRTHDAHQVRAHYDLSDDFYGLWLDARRVYSCAYYATPGMSLEQAQQVKLDVVCRKLRLAAGQRFLDIGAGWGALLLWAARHYDVRATGITLSKNQHAHVTRLIEDAGLSGRVDVRLLDYRDLPVEAFDRIASVGMFEHVGRGRMPEYFDRLRQLLRPGGLLLNHAISAGGLDNEQLGAGMGDFIEAHIFPGGELMHVARTVEGIARAGLEMVDIENLRPHYARTLWDWSAALERQLDRARQLTSDATVRAYRLYLAGSAMSFERGWLSVHQVLATRPEPCSGSGLAWAARSEHPFIRVPGAQALF